MYVISVEVCGGKNTIYWKAVHLHEYGYIPKIIWRVLLNNVRIATRYGLDISGSISGNGWFPASVQVGSAVHPASRKIGTGAFSLG
jgi:hypothetical protein